jgi:hypothetical protein
MKYLFILLFLSACGDISQNSHGQNIPSEVDKTVNLEKGFPPQTEGAFRIVVIDSCEYIVSYGGIEASSICHKGNCRFCAARAKANEGFPWKLGAGPRVIWDSTKPDLIIQQ